jgi:hypothetical protein
LKKVKEAVSTLGGTFDHLEERVVHGLDYLHDTLMSTRQQSDRQLAHTFLGIARKLLESSGGSTEGYSAISEECFDGLAGVPTGSLRVAPDITQPMETNNTNTPDADDEEDPANVHSLFRMVPKHISILDLVNEWYGTGDYYDEYGGIAGRNAAYKSQWRKRCSINAMHYSRTEQSVRIVEEYAITHGVDRYVAADRLQHVYAVECKESVTNFVGWGQDNGFIAKKKSRGRAAAAGKAQQQQ